MTPSEPGATLPIPARALTLASPGGTGSGHPARSSGLDCPPIFRAAARPAVATIRTVTEPGIETRYDRIAEGYARWWAPVIRPAAERVLQLADAAVAAGARELVDIGTGTGTLALAAIERWPDVRVTGVDASAGMLEMARAYALERLPARDRRRYRTRTAFADRMPVADGTFDLALSSFVLQLVPSRAAALREARRVLKVGATFAWVTWLLGGPRCAADDIANAVLDNAGFDPPEPEARCGDIASPTAAATAMRRAGFRDVRVREGVVEHAWDPASYLAFFTEFDEESLFAELEPDERVVIVAKMRARLDALTGDQLTLRLPIVYVSGRAV